MKRYISAILVPCFLLQLLAGCYSYREITYNELISDKNRNTNFIINDSLKYILNNEATIREITQHPNNIYCINTDTVNGDLLLIKKGIINNYDNKLSIAIDTLTIDKDKIKSIKIEKLDESETILLITGIIAVIAIGVYLVSQLPPRMDFTHLFGTPSK
jgi:hypothetical protein